jgi:hypothetical protein
VQARVLGLFDRYAWSKQTNEIHRELMANLENFSLTLLYHGPGDAKAPDRPVTLFLYVKDGADARATPAWKIKPITVDTAARVVETVAASGILDGLSDVHLRDIKAPKGPAYTITLQATHKEWYGVLGWGPELVKKLQRMGGDPGHPLHSALEPVWERLRPLAKEWSEEKAG